MNGIVRSGLLVGVVTTVVIAGLLGTGFGSAARAFSPRASSWLSSETAGGPRVAASLRASSAHLLPTIAGPAARVGSTRPIWRTGLSDTLTRPNGHDPTRSLEASSVSGRSAPGSAAPAPYVAATLVLANGTLIPGNFLGNGSGAGAAPDAEAYDSARGEMYVADAESDSVSVINDSTNTISASVPVGGYPLAAAYDGATGEVYVANQLTDNLSVINDRSNTVVATVPLPCNPLAMVFDSGNGALYTVMGCADVTVTGAANLTTFATISIPSGGAFQIAYDSAKGEIFVPNVLSGTVTIIDDTREAVLANLSVGTDPQAAAYDPTNGAVYVANGGSDNVSVVSDASDQVVATVPVGDNPIAAAWDEAGGSIYVVNANSGNLSVISGASNTVVATVVPGLGPFFVAYDPALAELFVDDWTSSVVVVVNGTSNGVVSTISLGTAPIDVVYDSARSELFVASLGTDLVTVVSTETNTIVANISVGALPDSLAYDPEGGEVFVCNSGSGNVSVISDATLSVVGTIPVDTAAGLAGNDPYQLAFDSGRGELFVGGAGEVSVISASNGSVVATVSFGSPVWGLAYDPSRGEVFVSTAANRVVVINDTSDTVVGTVTVGVVPFGLAFDPVQEVVVVANIFDNTVSVINDSSDRVVATIPVGGNPAGVVYDNETNTLYVTDWGTNAVTVINVTTDAVSTTLAVGRGPEGVAFDPARGFVYTSNQKQATISIIGTRPPAPTYAVTLTERGIPASLLAKDGWTVAVDGVVRGGTAPGLTLVGIPNGTYEALVTGPPGYRIVGGLGGAGGGTLTVTVSGATTLGPQFAKGPTATLTFNERGLPKGQRWCVEVNLDRVCSRTSSVKYAYLTPTTPAMPDYAYAVVSPIAGQNITVTLGTMALPTSGWLPLAHSEKVTLVFAYRYSVTFTETGLTDGSWSVTLQGVTKASPSGEPIPFEVTNGSYPYKVGKEPGYASTGHPPRVAVAGARVLVKVTFTAK